MSYEGLLTQTATITSRTQTGAEDDRNVPTWTTSVTHGVRCLIQQASSDEDNIDRETASQTATGFFAVGTELDVSDEIEVDGSIYEVIGPVDSEWQPRLSSVHHIEVKLREVIP